MRIGKALVFWSVGVVAVALAACASGEDPTHGGVVPSPTAELAARSGQSLDTIGQGYWVFQRKCSECHEAKLPKNPDKTGWHATASGMAWNAGLRKSEETVLLAYIDAAKTVTK